MKTTQTRRCDKVCKDCGGPCPNQYKVAWCAKCREKDLKAQQEHRRTGGIPRRNRGTHSGLLIVDGAYVKDTK